MHKRTKLLISGFLSLGLVGGAIAYHKSGHKHEGYARHLQSKLTKKLDLDEAQRAALDQVTQSMMESRKAFKNRKMLDLNQVLALLDADRVDQQKAMEMVRHRLSAIALQAEQMIASASGFTDSLSSEQRMELKQMVEKHMKHRKHHHHGHDDNYDDHHDEKAQDA